MSTQPHPCAAGPWVPGTDASDIPPSPDYDPQLYLVMGPQIGAGFKVAVAYIEMLAGKKVWTIADDEGGFYRLSDVLWFAEIRDPE